MGFSSVWERTESGKFSFTESKVNPLLEVSLGVTYQRLKEKKTCLSSDKAKVFIKGSQIWGEEIRLSLKLEEEKTWSGN